MSRKLSPLSILVVFIIPLVLFFAQAIYTTTSTSQIRWEEAGTAIRKPYWVANHEVNSGIDSNIGLDGVLNLYYHFFGVDLFTTKYIRLGLELISLVSLAWLLRKYLGEKGAIVPLVSIGLSPTLLFLVSLQIQYGLDLQYLPIVLVILDSLKFDLKPLDLLKQFLLWSLAMIAWMSYPTFVYVLPAIGILYLVKLHKNRKKLANLGVAAVSFLWPLTLGLLWIQNRQILISDPATNTGIFRGGGGNFFQEGVLDTSISNLISDLFSKGSSYNFDLSQSEFSWIFPVLTLLMTLAIGFYLLKKKSSLKTILIVSWLTLAFNLFVYLATSDPTGMPGLRRVTGSLAAFYALFTIAWYFVSTAKLEKPVRWLLMGILLLLPLHHILTFFPNLEGMKAPSKYQEVTLFSDPNLSPEQQYKNLVKQATQKDVYLSCQTDSLGINQCKYSDLYSLVEATCMWNHLSCHQVYGMDPNTNKYIPLTRDLWDSGYLER